MHPFLAQQFHAVLGGLGFKFFGCTQVGYQGEVHHQAVFLGQLPLQLAHGFNKGQAFNIAHGAANFGDHNIITAAFAQQQHAALDLVGNMGHHLHGLAQVSAFALLVDHGLVDAAGGYVVGLAGGDVQEALIVAQVEVGLCTIIRHIALAVLIGVEGARIHVDIGIEFLDGHPQTACLKKLGQTGRNNAFAQRGGYAPCHENVLSHNKKFHPSPANPSAGDQTNKGTRSVGFAVNSTQS